MQSSGESDDNAGGDESRRSRSPTGVLIQWEAGEREGGEACVLAVDSCGQVRDPVPAEVLRASDAGIVELLQRPRYLGDIGYVFEPEPERDIPQLHCKEYGRYCFLCKI